MWIGSVSRRCTKNFTRVREGSELLGIPTACRKKIGIVSYSVGCLLISSFRGPQQGQNRRKEAHLFENAG